MANIHNFQAFNELVSNPKNIDYIFNNVLLPKISKKVNVYDSILSHTNDYFRQYTVYFKGRKSEYELINKALKPIAEKYVKQGLVISFQIKEKLSSLPLGIYHEVIIYVKDLYTQRILPPAKLYHNTKEENVDSILENGIYPKGHEDGNFTILKDLYYPPCIFAGIEPRTWTHNKSIIEIDTSMIDNKWWYDLNLFEKIPKKNEGQTKAVMTFEYIDKKALKRYENKYTR